MKYDKITEHHIIPRSRGGKEKRNLVKVPNWEHNHYHQLFENKLPTEILDYLVNTFWGGRTEYLEQYLKQKS